MPCEGDGCRERGLGRSPLQPRRRAGAVQADMKISSKSIIFKTVVIYVFVTLINVTVFNVMVFVNQTGLIVENAKLSSQHKGSTLRYRIESAVAGAEDLTASTLNQILKEASALGIRDISVFGESGNVFVDVRNNQPTERTEADNAELKMINMAITKRDFEEKQFFHDVKLSTKSIDLYIPFTYSANKIGVVFARIDIRDIDDAMGFLYRQSAVIALIIIAIHVLFAWLLSKMILMPLRELNEATKSIASGQLEIRVPIVRDDEIGRLASSFNEMSLAIQRMRDEAKGANPLTGLPGNLAIARHIDECLAQGRIICVLYCDLDNFKAYNDKYGFTKGDEAILYTRDCLMQVAKRKDMTDMFVGHEGGDDFVVVCGYESWEPFAKNFITTFDRGIYQFYSSVDARNGYIESVNRRGERQRFPLMSISVAIVTNKNRPFQRHAEMIQVAAEVKKYVKSIDGSCYAIDRRQGQGKTAASPEQRPPAQTGVPAPASPAGRPGA